MKLFEPLYDKVIEWSKHKYAERYLAFVSFIESVFFPVPTALMLAPMVLAQRDRAWWLAWLTTVSSVAGGVVGYAVGYFLFDQVGELIVEMLGKEDKFNVVKDQFLQYGVWLVILAGVTPLPYKLCTIISGLLGLAIIPFIIGSLIGRAGQFFIVAGVLRWGGPAIETHLRKWMEWIGWGLIIVIIAVFVIVKL